MKIETRWVGKWVDITLYTENVRLDLGFYDTNARLELLNHLREVVDSLEAQP